MKAEQYKALRETNGIYREIISNFLRRCVSERYKNHNFEFSGADLRILTIKHELRRSRNYWNNASKKPLTQKWIFCKGNKFENDHKEEFCTSASSDIMHGKKCSQAGFSFDCQWNVEKLGRKTFAGRILWARCLALFSNFNRSSDFPRSIWNEIYYWFQSFPPGV